MSAVFVLENGELGTYYVSKMNMDFDHVTSRTREQLREKINKTYDRHPVVKHMDIDAHMTIRTLGRANPSEPFAYGVDRWIREIVKRIMKNPEQNEELRRLLTASWSVYYETENGAPLLLPDEISTPSTLSVFHAIPECKMTERNVLDMVKDFKENWGSGKEVPEKYKRMGIQSYSNTGATRCLNVRPPRVRGAEVTTDPDVLHARGRKKAIADMRRKRKPPKRTTIEKYGFTEDEIRKYTT